MTRRRAGLAAQVTAVTCAAALSAVLVAAAVAVGLVRHSYDAQARSVLHREALLVARLSERTATERATRAGRPAAQVLAGAGVRVVRVHADGNAVPPNLLPEAERVAVARGAVLQDQRLLNGHAVFLDVEPVPGDGGVALVERTGDARTVSRGVLRQLAGSLVVGLLVAGLLGTWLSRRTVRPLLRVAAAAGQLAAGHREVRLRPDGPAEVADVADSVNTLAGSLAASEARQREFLLSVSHELRTPLTAVLGFAEALRDGVSGDAREAGATIHAEASRLHRLVSDLLDLARLGADDFQVDPVEVELGALLTEVGRVWQARCQPTGVHFAVEGPSAPAWCRTDPTRLRQVLDGLLENALRVTPPGAPLLVSLRHQGAFAELAVRDGGPGLAEDDLAVAFDRSVLFHRYRGVREVGTGLGLALVAALVSRLGGTVRAGHAPEGGALFALRLPLVDPVRAADAPRP